MLNVSKSIPALALAGAMVVAAAGTAGAASRWEGGGGGGHSGGHSGGHMGGHSGGHMGGHMGGHSGGHMGGHMSGHSGGHSGYPGGHGGHGGKHHHRGHHRDSVIVFGDPYYPYYDYDYGYDSSCEYYRVKWHRTGRPYWLHRYEQCLDE